MIRYFDLFFFMLYVQSSLDNIVYENIVYKVIVYKVLCCKPIRAKFVLVLSLKVEQYIHTGTMGNISSSHHPVIMWYALMRKFEIYRPVNKPTVFPPVMWYPPVCHDKLSGQDGPSGSFSSRCAHCHIDRKLPIV